MAPPDPIPNSEVKHSIADGSVGSPHARVGNCQASNKTKGSVERLGLSFYLLFVGERSPASGSITETLRPDRLTRAREVFTIAPDAGKKGSFWGVFPAPGGPGRRGNAATRPSRVPAHDP